MGFFYVSMTIAKRTVKFTLITNFNPNGLANYISPYVYFLETYVHKNINHIWYIRDFIIFLFKFSYNYNLLINTWFVQWPKMPREADLGALF